MKHGKANHKENFPNCENENTGSCPYNSNKCWFNHVKVFNGESSEKINDSFNDAKNDKSNDRMKELVEMVEKYSERVVILENMLIK